MVKDELHKEISGLRTEMRTGFKEVNRKFGEVNKKFDAVNEKVDTLDEKVDTISERIDTLDEKVDTVALAVGRMENTLDGIAGAIQDLRTENGAGAAHLARHDRQIKTLARAINVALPN